jgi:CO/xanthine dehydrogenase FAD-binding subunit
VEDALRFVADVPDVIVVAGCTDLLVADAEWRAKRTHVMSVLEIEELHGIEIEDDMLRIGAADTFTEIARSEDVAEIAPSLSEAARSVGGWQIQNRATIGGNVVNASPAGDSLPVLLALDASVEIAGPGGRRRVNYADVHVGYRKTALAAGEILVAIRIPVAAGDRLQTFRKVGTRAAQAISKVVVAMAARREGGALHEVRVAAGSVADRPVRLFAAEAALEGVRASADLARLAGDAARREVSPIDDVRSTAEYRRWVLGNVVEGIVQAWVKGSPR